MNQCGADQGLNYVKNVVLMNQNCSIVVKSDSSNKKKQVVHKQANATTTTNPQKATTSNPLYLCMSECANMCDCANIRIVSVNLCWCGKLNVQSGPIPPHYKKNAVSRALCVYL